MKKFIIHNLGCKVNFAEISQIKQLLESNGYQHIVLNSTNLIETETPNFIFIHTCTVTDKADSDGRRLIRKYHKLFPYAKIVVLGCYAEIAYNELYEIEGVYKIYGNIDKFKILQNLENDTNTNIKNYKSNLCENTFYYADSAENEAHTRISMKIQDGCDYFCSYCAIPYSRGANRSMNFEDFKTQFKNIYHKGAKEVILSGINLGCYSGDSNDSNTKKTFSDIIEYIESTGYDLRVRISSIEPNLLTDKIIEICKNSKIICPHFHIPLQSGSDTILKLMKRRYTTKQFENLINKINNNIKYCGIGIDVITGFPGETDELFEETYQFLNGLEFSYLHVFSYSDRKIAPASKFSGKIDKKTKKIRTNRLIELMNKKKNIFIEKNLNNIHRIIPENFDNKSNQYSAWTDNYIHTKINHQNEIPLEKRFYNIKLVNLNCDSIVI